MKEKIKLNSEAISLRKKFGQDSNSPIDIFSLIHNNEDLTLMFYPMNKEISGICISEDVNKIIAINSTTTYGRQRFTIAHELYYLYFQNNFQRVVCYSNFKLKKDIQEQEADRFATYFLAPYESLDHFIKNVIKKNKQLELEDVIRIEQYYGMSREATLWRLIEEGYLKKDKAETMKVNIISSVKKLGYDIKLYLPSSQDNQYITYGKYIKLAEKLKNEEKISQGKYEELLLEGFRGDIVYGLDKGKEIYD